ncbi:hypothetical protein AK812_SmicGene36510, partial [Symbiodinium microadriaticum]
ELATATITLRGSFTAAYLPIIEAALESVLGMFCDDESILIFTERLVSDVGGGTYSMTVEFQILPPRDGGGTCAADAVRKRLLKWLQNEEPVNQSIFIVVELNEVEVGHGHADCTFTVMCRFFLQLALCMVKIRVEKQRFGLENNVAGVINAMLKDWSGELPVAALQFGQLQLHAPVINAKRDQRRGRLRQLRAAAEIDPAMVKKACGDCAWELIAAADGADAAPFEECEDCVRKKPLFRRALENQIWMYPGTRSLPLASWYVKMFSIFCHRLDVIRPRNFPSMQTQDWRCEDFFLEATAHPPDPGAVTTTAASGGPQTTTRRVVSSDDPCSWISSSCLCATVPRCSWNSGLGTCVEVAVPHSDSERCGFCPTLPWCDPSPAQECPTALTICSCALMGPQCNWTLATGRCFAPASGPTGVPCSLCPLSTANCPRPIVTQVTPPADTLLGWGDYSYDLTVTFDRPVRLPRPSDTITGDIFLMCELEAGQFIPWDAPQGGTLRIEVPESKRLILNGGLQVRLQLSNHSFWSRYLCTLNIQDGAMVDVAEDVPCVAASWHRASMSDNMAPLATTIAPESGLRDISIDVSEATVRFNEPVYLMAIREATLFKLDPNNGPERYNEVAKLPVTLTDTVEVLETLKISLSDVRLEHDSVYSIHIPAGVVVDRANNGFAGLEVGVWAFRTEIGGTVEQLDFGLSAGAIAGIAAGLVVFVSAIACGLVFFRWKVVRKYEDSRVKPEEGSTPKASQVVTLHNDAEHLPSNERFWERALVRSKEDLADAEADELEELPGTIHSHHGSRRPSVASNSETNQRRPSVASNFETNQRRPSNASSTAPVGRVRNESKQSSQNSRRPSKSTDVVQFYSNEQPAQRQLQPYLEDPRGCAVLAWPESFRHRATAPRVPVLARGGLREIRMERPRDLREKRHHHVSWRGAKSYARKLRAWRPVGEQCWGWALLSLRSRTRLGVLASPQGRLPRELLNRALQ